MLKKVSIGIMSLLLAIAVFYFWGSSSNLKADDYASINQHENIEASYFERDTFRLMTYNMGYLSGMTNNKVVEKSKALFDTNLDAINSLIQELKVDIICFQEIDFNSNRSFFVDQLQEMAETNEFPYSSRVINWDKKYVPFPYWPPTMHFGEVLSGQAILSLFPIIENERIILEKADYAFYYNAFYLDRLAQINLISIGGRDVILINVHLEAYDARTREKQADQLIALYKKYEKLYPVIVLGDFNSTPPGAKEPYMVETTMDRLIAIEGIKMAITGSRYMQNEKEYFTFNSIEPYIKIDYIFYSENTLKVENSYVVREAGEISDHLPVITDVIFKN